MRTWTPTFAVFALISGLTMPGFVGCSGTKDSPADADADTDTDTDSDSDADTDTDTDTDSDADTDTDTDTDTDSDSDADRLADVREQMLANSDACEELSGNPVAGAREYFWGEYDQGTSSEWAGKEAIYYFANTTWKASGGADCVIVWDTVATSGGTGACSTCDLGLAVSANLNTSETTCPSAMWSGDEMFNEDYAIETAADGTASWRFASSNTEFGAGYWISGAANYLSDSSCVWF
jgi:hypothetical protein